MKTRFLAVGMMFAGLGAATAWADFTYSASTSGTTSGGSVAGSVAFDFNNLAGTGTITLTNTGPVASIAQVLDGLAFTTTGGTGFTLVSVSPSGFETCTGSGPTEACSSTGSGTSPYGWTLGGTVLLAAGAGSFKPDGIVNTGITPTDGLGNGPHNPYLLGPVTFNFSYTGTVTAINSLSFLWGTTPESTGAPGVPTPDGGLTVMLLGGALVGLETLRRRFRA